MIVPEEAAPDVVAGNVVSAGGELADTPA